MGDLSKHFSINEVECKCGCGYHSVNPVTLQCVEKLRESWGLPIIPGSVCRCTEHNKHVGGSRTSKHLTGEAFDIPCRGLIKQAELLDIILNIPEFHNGGIGLYDWGIHVDTRDNGPSRWNLRTNKG